MIVRYHTRNQRGMMRMTDDTPPPFPLGYGSVTITTRRGRAVRIRHIVPEDAALLVDLFNHLSPETRRMRFLRPRNDVPNEVFWPEARRFAAIDPLVEAALIGLVSEEDRDHAVGVARLARDADDPNVAEMAIVLRDDYQGEGLGTLLFDLLLQVAMVRGLKRLVAISLAENDAFRRLVRKSGLPFTSQTAYGETTTTITLSDA
jgi:RimJ/RimL family protein N-acetyltransferase